jgi:hypothetical protein
MLANTVCSHVFFLEKVQWKNYSRETPEARGKMTCIYFSSNANANDKLGPTGHGRIVLSQEAGRLAYTCSSLITHVNANALGRGHQAYHPHCELAARLE